MVNKLTPFAILVALLSLSDYVSLIIAKVNIPDVFILFIFFGLSLISFVYYNQSKVSLSQLTYMLLVSVYFTAISIFNFNQLIVEALNVLLSFFTAVLLYLVIKKRSLLELFDLLSKALFFYLLGALFLELINKVIGGNNLIIVFQNNLPYLLVIMFSVYSFSKALGFEQRRTAFVYSVYLISIYILYAISEFGNYRIQFKIVFLLFILMLFLLFEKFFIKKFELFKILLFLIVLMFIPFFWLIQAQLELFVNASGRLGSGMMRVEVFKAIIETFNNFTHMLIGAGIGASSMEFAVVHNDVVYELRTHSGFASLMLDFGLLGLILLFCLPCVLLLFKLRKSPHSFLYGLLLVFCWLFLNIVYVSAIPSTNIYNYSMLSLALVSIGLFKKFKMVK